MLRPGSVRKAQVAVGQALELCDVHQKETVRLFCKTCSSLVCDDCIVGDHAGHLFNKIKEVAEEKRKDLERKLEKIETKGILYMIETLEKLREVRNRHTEDSRAFIYAVQRRADELKSEIDKVKDDIIKEAKLLQAKEEKTLLEFEQELESTLSSTQNLVTSCHDELKSTRDIRVIKLGFHLEDEISISDQVFQIPSVQSLVFVTGKFDKEALQTLFGRSITREENDFEKLLVEKKLEVESTFQHCDGEAVVRSIVAQDDQSAWIATTRSKEIKHVQKSSKIDKTLTFASRINDIAVLNDGSLLVAPNGASGNSQCQLKKIKSNGDSVTFADVKPLKPCSVCVSSAGNIYVGCCDRFEGDVTETSTRCIMKLSDTGVLQKKIEFDDKGQKLFTNPYRIMENVNGDIWVRDRIDKSKGRVIVLQSDGKLRFMYRGLKSDRAKNPFRPSGIAALGDNNMIVSDSYNGFLHVVSGDGILLQLLGSQNLPFSVSYDKDNQLLWVGTKRCVIQVLHYVP